MRTNLIISLTLLIAACGDNITRPDARPNVGPNGPTDDPPIGPGICVDVDDLGLCPTDDPPALPDAGVAPDAFVPPLSDDQKAACCHALLDGTPPNQDCGYPPGLCRNGRKDMFCKNADGTDAKFTLCNP